MQVIIFVNQGCRELYITVSQAISIWAMAWFTWIEESRIVWPPTPFLSIHLDYVYGWHLSWCSCSWFTCFYRPTFRLSVLCYHGRSSYPVVFCYKTYHVGGRRIWSKRLRQSPLPLHTYFFKFFLCCGNIMSQQSSLSLSWNKYAFYVLDTNDTRPLLWFFMVDMDERNSRNCIELEPVLWQYWQKLFKNTLRQGIQQIVSMLTRREDVISAFWCLVEGIAVHKNTIDGLVQERRSSNALAMELHLSCTNPSKCPGIFFLTNLLHCTLSRMDIFGLVTLYKASWIFDDRVGWLFLDLTANIHVLYSQMRALTGIQIHF